MCLFWLAITKEVESIKPLSVPEPHPYLSPTLHTFSSSLLEFMVWNSLVKTNSNTRRVKRTKKSFRCCHSLTFKGYQGIRFKHIVVQKGRISYTELRATQSETNMTINYNTKCFNRKGLTDHILLASYLYKIVIYCGILWSLLTQVVSTV